MKSLLLTSCFTVLFTSLSYNALSQVVKKEEVIERRGNQIHYFYSLDNREIPGLFSFMGRNGQYQQLIDFTTIYSGDAKGLYDLLTELNDFTKLYKKEGDVSKPMSDLKASRVKLGGGYLTWIYKSDGKFICIPDNDYTRFIDALVEFCDKNNIKYK